MGTGDEQADLPHVLQSHRAAPAATSCGGISSCTERSCSAPSGLSRTEREAGVELEDTWSEPVRQRRQYSLRRHRSAQP